MITIKLWVCRSLCGVQQFSAGASALMNLVRQHPAALKELFVNCSNPLTFQSFRKLYCIMYSEAGSNKRILENDAVFAWEICLQKCEGQLRRVREI